MKKILSFLLVLAVVISALAPCALAEESRSPVFTQAMSLLFPSGDVFDPAAALELLLPLAESGDAEAQYYCGWIYDFELEENTETELQAYNWYEPAAEQGHIKASVGAALNTFAKSSEPLDYALSEGFLEMSDEQLGPDGLYWIGFMYYNGLGLERNEDEALLYFTKSAERNSVLGMMGAAYMLDDYPIASPRGELCLELYERAAALNYAPAMYELGLKHYFNYHQGVESSLPLAFEWFSKAAELGDVASMSQLGQLYQSGEGTEENPELAFEWYSRAVELGDTHSMCMLGHMYRDGEWVEQDYDIAMNYFIDAAVNGNISAPRVVELMLYFNQGVEVYNEREAEFLAATAD